MARLLNLGIEEGAARAPGRRQPSRTRVHEAGRQGPVAHGAGDPVGRPRADVAGGEDAGPHRLQQVGRAVGQRPGEAAVAGGRPRAAQQVARRVDPQHAGDRLRARLGADHHEHRRGPAPAPRARRRCEG